MTATPPPFSRCVAPAPVRARECVCVCALRVDESALGCAVCGAGGARLSLLALPPRAPPSFLFRASARGWSRGRRACTPRLCRSFPCLYFRAAQEGTRENPIPILSIEDSRVVGVSLPDDATVRWFTLKAGELTYDPNTCNWFALKKVSKSEVDEWVNRAEKQVMGN